MSSGFERGNEFSLYHIKDRTSSVVLLFQHILFESGVVLKKYTPEDAEIYILEACEGTVVTPELVHAIVAINGHNYYAINLDGSMGAMRVLPSMLDGFTGTDPFLLKDNLKVGVAFLDGLLKEDSDVQAGLKRYFETSSEGSANLRLDKSIMVDNIYEQYLKNISSYDLYHSVS